MRTVRDRYSLIVLTVSRSGRCPGGYSRRRPNAGYVEDEYLVHHHRGLERNTPGCYGNLICQTPNLDRFATSAVRFDSAYVQAICCNPSRSSFLNGLRPLTSRVWNNGQEMDQRLPPGTVSLPELLKKGASIPLSSASSSIRWNTPRSNCWPLTGSRATASRRDGRDPIPSCNDATGSKH